ncbi:unnamed protein product, partial [Symbiodinium sp. KB8]
VQWNRTETDKFSAHADTNHNLFVSDTNRIVCYDREGKYQPLLTNIEPHHIVPNGTADFVVLLRKSDKQKLSKVDAKGNLATILETPSPLYGPDICPNGDVVHHPSTSRLERRSPSGELVASIEGGRGKAVVPPVVDSNLCFFCSRLLRAFPESHIPVDRHGGAGRVA